MKVTLIANISANGRVLLSENPKHQAPPEALGFFVQTVREAGNLIIGNRTLEVLKQFPGGPKQLFPGAEIVVLSSNGEMNSEYKLLDNPTEAIQYLSGKGFSEVIIGGGTKTYNVFLEKDLVTDIYFNFIPMIIGDGGIIGTGNDLNIRFMLEEYKSLTDDIVQIHLVKA